MIKPSIANWILIILVAILLMIVAKLMPSNFENFPWKDTVLSLAISIISAIFCALFLYIPLGPELKKMLIKLEGNDISSNDIIKCKRNSMMGENFWNEFLTQVTNESSTLYFIGTRQHLWINENLSYRKKLVNVLKNRLYAHCTSTKKNVSEYCLTIILSDKETLAKWKTLISEVKQKLEKEYQGIQPTMTSFARFGYIDEKMIKYSIVCTQCNIVVVQYSPRGGTPDNLTIEVNPKSDLGSLYFEDVQFMEEKAEFQQYEQI